jgi:hypothetical protein
MVFNKADLRKVPIDLASMQKPDEGNRIIVNNQADSIFTEFYPVVAAFHTQLLQIRYLRKGLGRFNLFDHFLNLTMELLIPDSFQIPGKTGFEIDFHGRA